MYRRRVKFYFEEDMLFVLRIIRILCVMVSSVSVAVLVGVGSIFFDVPIISV